MVRDKVRRGRREKLVMGRRFFIWGLERRMDA